MAQLIDVTLPAKRTATLVLDEDEIRTILEHLYVSSDGAVVFNDLTRALHEEFPDLLVKGKWTATTLSKYHNGKHD